VSPRKFDVREDRVRSDEYVVFESHAFEELSAVLELAAVTDDDERADVDAFADGAALADRGTLADVRVPPHGRSARQRHFYAGRVVDHLVAVGVRHFTASGASSHRCGPGLFRASRIILSRASANLSRVFGQKRPTL
jgi:hypothetical protein